MGDGKEKRKERVRRQRVVFQVWIRAASCLGEEVLNSTCVGCYLKDSWPGVSMISRPGSLISVLANCGQRREDKHLSSWIRELRVATGWPGVINNMVGSQNNT